MPPRKPREEGAAISIQALARGYLARKHVAQKRAQREREAAEAARQAAEAAAAALAAKKAAEEKARQNLMIGCALFMSPEEYLKACQTEDPAKGAARREELMAAPHLLTAQARERHQQKINGDTIHYLPRVPHL